MKIGLRSPLPESPEDFIALRDAKLLRHLACFDCKKPFTTASATTPAGWRDTQIVGICEPCFDKLTDAADPEDALDDGEGF